MRTIILASSSPRRRELFEWLGLPFEVVDSNFNERMIVFDESMDVTDYTTTIAMGKVLSIAHDYQDAIIIGADTTVYFDNDVIGKPKDLDHAREILKRLRGRTHQVCTSIFALDTLTTERHVDSVTTQVEFFSFSDESLDQYISTSESLGKAGAYGIQGSAKTFVKSVEGSFSNVVGLPLLETIQILSSLGVNSDVNIQSVLMERFGYST